MSKRFDAQLEDMYYETYGRNCVGWITLEDENGNEVDIDFNFECNFNPLFDEWFAANEGNLYARWNAAEKSDPFVSERVLLNRR